MIWRWVRVDAVIAHHRRTIHDPGRRRDRHGRRLRDVAAVLVVSARVVKGR
jgi:hypothetical protein